MRKSLPTKGDKARILTSLGKIDEALQLHEERLTIFGELGDKRSLAISLIDVARIHCSGESLNKALHYFLPGYFMLFELKDANWMKALLELIFEIVIHLPRQEIITRIKKIFLSEYTDRMADLKSI